MASWDDAFLIFSKWRDERTLLTVFREFSQTEHGEMTLSGSTAFILDVNAMDGTVLAGLDRETAEDISLLGAEFEYSDPRSSPLVDGQWECSLEARWPGGEMILFAEKPSLPE